MSEYPGIFRKGPGRGHVYRFREFDQAKGKVVHRTSPEYSSARKAAAARSGKLKEIAAASIASRRPTREGITIEGAWAKHPSTVREPEERRKKYRKLLAAFTDHMGYTELRKLTFADVSDWIEQLKAQGYVWPTRFHYLLPLRRAARMAVTVGLPDVLAEMHIDERETREHDVQAWTLAEIAKGWHALANNRRARVCLGLGAFVGLRPSELYRAKCGDLDADGRLAIGIRQGSEVEMRQAKNKPSRRKLPLPAIVLAEVRALIALRPPTAPMIATAKLGKPPTPFKEGTLSEWLGPLLETATGRDLPPKHLRKTFASWTIAAGIDFWHVEAYLGHDTPLTKSITGRHYLADLYDVISKQLDPTAQRLNDLIATALETAKTALQNATPNGEHAGEHARLGNTSAPLSDNQSPSKASQNGAK